MVVIFSLDYDGCACALDPRAQIGIKNDRGVYEQFKTKRGYSMGTYVSFANQHPLLPIAIDKVKTTLEQEMRKYYQEGSIIELYVGSNRQSKALDSSNARQNHNGSCFEVYTSYAKRNNMKLRPLLLADVDQGDPCNPRAMHLALHHPHGSHPTCSLDLLKDKTIIAQLQDAARNHPDEEEVTFVFFDDDYQNTIIPNLQRHIQLAYQNAELVKTLPQKISLHFYKYDWFPVVSQVTNPKQDETELLKSIATTMATPKSLHFNSRCALLEEKKPVDEIQSHFEHTPLTAILHDELGYFYLKAMNTEKENNQRSSAICNVM